MKKWFGVAEASDLSGLKPSTLQCYARSRQSSLVRNVDYRVERRIDLFRTRKRLLFSERGLQRLIDRDYRVFPWLHRPPPASKPPLPKSKNLADLAVSPDPSELVFPEHSTPRDKARITREYLTQCVTYLLEHPCAREKCECACHAVLPALDAMLRQYEHDANNKATIIGRKRGAPREETGLLTGRQIGPGYVPRYR